MKREGKCPGGIGGGGLGERWNQGRHRIEGRAAGSGNQSQKTEKRSGETRRKKKDKREVKIFGAIFSLTNCPLQFYCRCLHSRALLGRDSRMPREQ